VSLSDDLDTLAQQGKTGERFVATVRYSVPLGNPSIVEKPFFIISERFADFDRSLAWVSDVLCTMRHASPMYRLSSVSVSTVQCEEDTDEG